MHFSDDNNSTNSNTIPPSLPKDEPSLKKLFNDITAQCDFAGMNVVGKYHIQNRSHAIVEYSPKNCQCPCQDFKWAAEEHRMLPMITEVKSNLSFLKL
jgi:hypothetical protein